jgi:hypothetical protein
LPASAWYRTATVAYGLISRPWQGRALVSSSRPWLPRPGMRPSPGTARGGWRSARPVRFVGIFPSRDAILRLAGAILAEQ